MTSNTSPQFSHDDLVAIARMMPFVRQAIFDLTVELNIYLSLKGVEGWLVSEILDQYMADTPKWKDEHRPVIRKMIYLLLFRCPTTTMVYRP